MTRVGFIVNPVAGMGGRVGLKGTDGSEVQSLARAMGATPMAPSRASTALEQLLPLREKVEFLAAPLEMGATLVRDWGLMPTVVGSLSGNGTSAEDTRRIAAQMVEKGVDLILFAGGDGTARDVFTSVGAKVPVVGIPAGVKIHSGVFAENPRKAGQLAVLFCQGGVRNFCEAEVMDIDEEAFRTGAVRARLFGFMKVPNERRFVQRVKAGSGGSEAVQQQAIARSVMEGMERDILYVIGSGSTTRAVMSALGLPCTLLGVDLVMNGRIVDSDVGEERLLSHLEEAKPKLVITPIGGQGFLFGRGNQQLSPKVIRKTGRENVIVIATPQKLHSLQGGALLVDTGEDSLDQELCGAIKVVTGYREYSVVRVEC